MSSVSDPPNHVVHTTVTVEDVDDVWDKRPLYYSNNITSLVSVYSPRLTSNFVTFIPFVLSSLSFFTDVLVLLDDD